MAAVHPQQHGLTSPASPAAAMTPLARKSDDVVTVVDARPYSYSFPAARTALLMIDMQRDFLLPGGFADALGADLADVAASVEPARRLLAACRGAGMHVFHTREGHAPDLSDCPSSKLARQAEAPGGTVKKVIGDKGRMGRLLVRGEYGHDFVDELQPQPGEVVIDKPGKGAFWGTEIMRKLKAYGITHLLVGGVTTECCVTTSFREANDRGFECCAVTEATAGYNPAFKTASLDMLFWSQGLFGFVCNLDPLLDALDTYSGKKSSPSLNTPPQTPPEWDGDMRISSLQAAYRSGLSPVNVVEALYAKIEAYESINPGGWIHLLAKDDVLAVAQELVKAYPDKSALPPLFGVPFTVKDSIDVAGLPTTTACPPLSHIASASAPVHDSVLAAGALFLGKSNLDQLATGLTGQRSPYGAPRSVFHGKFISGGSSSGSAVLVGARLCSFSLATDTAGSGRVPASLNGIVGYKPTRGTVPFVGITPACLRLDCVALMAATVSDARAVWQVVEGFSDLDPYAKPREWRAGALRHVNATGPQAGSFRFGIPPPDALAVLHPAYRAAFAATVARLQRLGGRLVPADWTPFKQAGDLLYDGSFVSERLASIPDLRGSDGSDAAAWLARYRPELHPVIVDIFEAVLARRTDPARVYKELQMQVALTAQVHNHVFTPGKGGVDVLVVPTAPTHPTVKEVAAEPIKKNSFLGTFTHAGNVLDLCGVATPAATVSAEEMLPEAERESDDAPAAFAGKVLPFGVTFLGGAGSDAEVLDIARRFQELASEEGAI